jgi:hypothetical protein
LIKLAQETQVRRHSENQHYNLPYNGRDRKDPWNSSDLQKCMYAYRLYKKNLSSPAESSPPRISPIVIRINSPSQTNILDSGPLLPIRVPAITTIDKHIEIAVTPAKVPGPLAPLEYIDR